MCLSAWIISHLRYFGIHFDRMLTYRKHVETNTTDVQERSVSPSEYDWKGHWTTPPLPALSKCGDQCHWLRTRPHSNGTDKSAEAGHSAERGNASHTGNHQGYTHWDHEVHARPPTNANETESGAGQSILQCYRNSPWPTYELAMEDKKGCRLGRGQSWMGQTQDSVLQSFQLTEPKQT